MGLTGLPALDLTTLGAAELARRIASGDLSAGEVVEAHIRRIEEVNPRLNAVVVKLFDQARAEARAADAAREEGKPLGPLHGVPFTIKECFDVAGTPTTAGFTEWARRIAARDSPLVARLRRAGAIVLGKTNVPQALLLYETDNPLYGRTDNPWNLRRSPGGSSGGEAAIISAGGSPLGLGSDAGGSIRHPAHSSGISGLKPTSGRLTLMGHPIFQDGSPSSVFQAGPMARRVEDLALALKVLAAPGEEAVDPEIPPAPLRDPAAVSVRGLRVGVYSDDGSFSPSPAIRRAVREAASALRELGAQVEEFRPPEVAEAARIYFGLLLADGLAPLERCLRKGKRDWRISLVLASTKTPGILRPLLARGLAVLRQRRLAAWFRACRKRSLSADAYRRLLEERAAYRRHFLRALDERGFDAILSPPFAVPALTHGKSLFLAFAVSYAFLYNLLGMPAGVVAATRVRPGEESDRPPSKDVAERMARAVERGSAGLPVGVQVAARHWREDVALKVMGALEEHFRAQPDYPARPPAAAQAP